MSDWQRFQVAVIAECRKVHKFDPDKAAYLNEIGWNAFHSKFFHSVFNVDRSVVPWNRTVIWKMYSTLAHYHGQFVELGVNWNRLMKLAEAAKEEESLLMGAT